jgi:hypothetical protein
MKAAAIVAAALGAAMLLIEVALRVIGYSSPQWYQLDPHLGWSLRPHRAGVHLEDGQRTFVRINNAGFRDRDRFVDKLEGIYRIAVLGDEVSEAMQVNVDQTWWWRLPPLLQSCTKERRVEVLNFAVGGYGTGQELITLETTAMRYQPDLVLLQFSNANDVADNSFALSRRKLRPFYRVDALGVPRLSESFAASPAFERRMQTRYRLGVEIADHSRAFQLVRQLAEQVDGFAFVGAARADRDIAILGAPRGELWQEAWHTTEALLARMQDFSNRNGARFVIVAAPHPLQPVNAMVYPDQRLAQFGARRHVPVVSLAPVIRPELYLKNGEWSTEAHRVAAEAVAARICPLPSALP